MFPCDAEMSNLEQVKLDLTPTPCPVVDAYDSSILHRMVITVRCKQNFLLRSGQVSLLYCVLLIYAFRKINFLRYLSYTCI